VGRNLIGFPEITPINRSTSKKEQTPK
jgi:hypothetical protein